MSTGLGAVVLTKEGNRRGAQRWTYEVTAVHAHGVTKRRCQTFTAMASFVSDVLASKGVISYIERKPR